MNQQEEQLLASIDLEVPWSLVQHFAGLTRVSGSPDEAAAAEYLAQRLAAFGIPHTVHRPELYLSIPKAAGVTLRVAGAIAGERFAAKTPSFSVSTAGGPGRSGRAIWVAAGPAHGIGDLFAAAAQPVSDLAGCVVVTEGLPMPARVLQYEQAGAVAAVFVSPGERIHEAICTPVWGTPDLTSNCRQPRLAVASVSRSDGGRLRSLLETSGGGAELTVNTQLDVGWYRCPLVVAEIPGSERPEEFVLLHGHLDSWHVGIGDNATGNAAMLEIARCLWLRRSDLARSVRIAWWPGHSTGRYAGSTWYADAYAQDLHRNCILHLNCDSPGCRWATEFRDLTVMAETAGLASGAVRDGAGLACVTAPPERAGDLSFSNLGVSTLFMLSSTMSDADRAARGYHAVGGCGGNIGWHTEDDTLDIADRDNLQRDMRVYALAVWRAANDPIHPLDFRATADQIAGLLQGYAGATAAVCDLAPAIAAAGRLRQGIADFYARAAAQTGNAEAAHHINDRLRRLGRILVNLLYSQAGRYRQDPALPVPPLPELQAAAAACNDRTVDRGIVRTEIVRAQNRIVGAVEEALELLDA